jgi:hypothetical protein
MAARANRGRPRPTRLADLWLEAVPLEQVIATIPEGATAVFVRIRQTDDPDAEPTEGKPVVDM